MPLYGYKLAYEKYRKRERKSRHVGQWGLRIAFRIYTTTIDHQKQQESGYMSNRIRAEGRSQSGIKLNSISACPDDSYMCWWLPFLWVRWVVRNVDCTSGRVSASQRDARLGFRSVVFGGGRFICHCVVGDVRGCGMSS